MSAMDNDFEILKSPNLHDDLRNLRELSERVSRVETQGPSREEFSLLKKQVIHMETYLEALDVRFFNHMREEEDRIKLSLLFTGINIVIYFLLR